MIIVMLKESPRLDDVRAVASLGLGFGLSLARQYRARFSGFAEAETNPGRARPGCSVLTDEVVAPGRVAINPNRISRVVPSVSGRVVKGMAKLGVTWSRASHALLDSPGRVTEPSRKGERAREATCALARRDRIARVLRVVLRRGRPHQRAHPQPLRPDRRLAAGQRRLRDLRRPQEGRLRQDRRSALEGIQPD